MKHHQLITIPNKLLVTPSKKVNLVDDEIRTMVRDMEKLTVAWDHDSELGVALAAIQVGIPLRLAIIRNNMGEKPSKDFTTFINPEIVRRSDQTLVDIEGCLSVPNVYGRVRRHAKIKIKAEDLNGDLIQVTAEGFLARVFEHEIDHMNGIMFLEHIKKLKDLFSIEKDGKLIPLDKAPEGYEHIK